MPPKGYVSHLALYTHPHRPQKSSHDSTPNFSALQLLNDP